MTPLKKELNKVLNRALTLEAITEKSLWTLPLVKNDEINWTSISQIPEINEEDIKTVMEQTGKSKEEAKSAIEDTNGDLAEAILKLTE